MAYSIFSTDKDGRHITIMDSAWDRSKADFKLVFDNKDFADYFSLGWVKAAVNKKLRESLHEAFEAPDFDESGWYNVADFVICGCWKNRKRKFVSCEYEISFHVNIKQTTAGAEYGITFGAPCFVHVSEANVEMGD
jgi:hypothetical protein